MSERRDRMVIEMNARLFADGHGSHRRRGVKERREESGQELELASESRERERESGEEKVTACVWIGSVLSSVCPILLCVLCPPRLGSFIHSFVFAERADR